MVEEGAQEAGKDNGQSRGVFLTQPRILTLHTHTYTAPSATPEVLGAAQEYVSAALTTDQLAEAAEALVLGTGWRE